MVTRLITAFALSGDRTIIVCSTIAAAGDATSLYGRSSKARADARAQDPELATFARFAPAFQLQVTASVTELSLRKVPAARAESDNPHGTHEVVDNLVAAQGTTRQTLSLPLPPPAPCAIKMPAHITTFGRP